MSKEMHEKVMHILNEHREDLIHQVAESLFANVPVIGIWEGDEDKVAHHHRNMAITAERFHDIVQAGATVDWALVVAEFGWADRKLSQMGITHGHHQILISTYFDKALNLCEWSSEERRELSQIADELYRAAKKGYEDAMKADN